MSKQEASWEALRDYLPDGCFDEIVRELQLHKVHLTISKARKSVLGDYRNSFAHNNHRISVNGNLNRYSFLITLLHELAHLYTFVKYRHSVSAHGVEWKKEFSTILIFYVNQNIFPIDIRQALEKSLRNPSASSCADTQLTRVLSKYDSRKEGFLLVENLPEGSLFVIKGGQVFKKEKLLRKRIRCVEVATGKVYLFSPVYEVKIHQ